MNTVTYLVQQQIYAGPLRFLLLLAHFYSLVIRLSRVCCWPLNFQSTGKILYQYVHKCSCNELFRRNVHFLSRKLFKNTLKNVSNSNEVE